MELGFCSFASGSSGNCYLIKSREAAILIDAGITTKRIHRSLEDVGVDRSEIRGIFVTHEHSDHVKGIKVLTKQNPDWEVIASPGTATAIAADVYDPKRIGMLEAGHDMKIADMTVRSLRVSHDAAEPVCYSVSCNGSKITIVTDTGYVPEEVQAEMTDSDLVVLEANHEVNMLKAGPYPYYLKQRILGDQGHLSNETAGDVISGIMESEKRFRRVYLAHLSDKNNFPDLARQTVKNILEEHDFLPGRDLALDVMKRESISGVTEL